jgi:superfamily I DNA/RNA helicase
MKTRIVIGPPGTGKTTYLTKKAWEAVRRFGSSAVLFASLTKAAAAEAAAKKVNGLELPLPKRQIGTLHSHAFNSLGHPEVALTKKDHLEEWNKSNPQYRMVASFVDRESPWNGRPALGDELLATLSLRRARFADGPMPGTLSDFSKRWSDFKRANSLMDFDDMIHEAIDSVPAAPGRPSIIYLDEAQDHSRAEFKLAMKWGHAAGTLVAAGDPYQALYDWRGASPDTFLALSRDPEHRKVLAKSWRIPASVHKKALGWISKIPDYEAFDYDPREQEGEVRYIGGSMTSAECIVGDAEANYLSRDKTVMFLASCSYIVDPIVACLKEKGIPFHNPYRVTNGAWNPMRGAERLRCYLRPDPFTWGENAGPWTWKELDMWVSIVASKNVLRRGMKAQVADLAKNTPDAPIAGNIEEAIETVSAIFNEGVKWWDPDKLSVFESIVLSKRIAPLKYAMAIARARGGARLLEKPSAMVGTIHSVKGGEADAVYVFPDISLACHQYSLRNPKSMFRLSYVAMTRARESLVICQSGSPYFVNGL